MEFHEWTAGTPDIHAAKKSRQRNGDIMTVTIVIVGQQVALRSTIKIRNTTMIASGGAGLKIHQEMADAPLHTGRRSNKKSKDLKWQKNSFCQRLG